MSISQTQRKTSTTPAPSTPAPAPASAPAAKSSFAPAVAVVPVPAKDQFRATAAPPATPKATDDSQHGLFAKLRSARKAIGEAVSNFHLPELHMPTLNLGPLRIPTKETGHDQVGLPGKPATLECKLEMNGPSYLDPDLKGKPVNFYVNGKLAGTGVTDRDGVARVPFTPPAQGQYQITYDMADPKDRGKYKDDENGKATLHVMPDKPTLVVDIDGTLSDYPELKVPISGEKAGAFKNSVDTLNALSKDYNIVYLTARDDALTDKSRQFLFKDHDPNKPGAQAFPSGPVLFNDQGLSSYGEISQFDPKRHAAFKTEAIKQLQLAGIPVVGGIGNAVTDRIAYQNTGLDAFILDADREKKNPGEFYDGVLKSLSDPAKKAEYKTRVDSVVQQRSAVGTDAAFQRDLDILSGAKATSGNKVDILVDGEMARPEFLKAFDSAKSNIIYQTFEFHNDEAGKEIASKLCEKAQQGVKVRVMFDALGSKHLPPFKKNPIIEQMQKAGVEVQPYNPLQLKELPNFLHRDHRKAISIDDGSLSFIGGMNTGTHYMGSETKASNFHDLFLKVQGPAAKDVAKMLYNDWKGPVSEAEKEGLNKPNPPAAGADQGTVRIINHASRQDFDIKDTYIRMIHEAKDHVFLMNSFPIDQDMANALKEARARGVEVNYVYGPSEKAAMALTLESKLPDLIKAGVKVYRYPEYVHAKTLSIDGKVATVGSSNVDNYALEMNNEAVALMSDPAWVKRYEEKVLREDIPKCQPVPADPKDPFWKKAGLGELISKLWPDWLE